MSGVVGALVGAQRIAVTRGLTRAARQNGQWRARIKPLIAPMTARRALARRSEASRLPVL